MRGGEGVEGGYVEGGEGLGGCGGGGGVEGGCCEGVVGVEGRGAMGDGTSDRGSARHKHFLSWTAHAAMARFRSVLLVCSRSCQVGTKPQ